LNKTDTSSYIEVPVVQPLRVELGNSNVIPNESIRSEKVTRLPDKSVTEALKVVESHQNSAPLPTGITNSFSKTGLFTEVTPDMKKLQSGFKPEAFLIDPHDSVGCAPLKVRFHNKSTSYDSCRWTFGDGGYSTKRILNGSLMLKGNIKLFWRFLALMGTCIINCFSDSASKAPGAF